VIDVALGTLAETPATALLNPVDAQWQAATPVARRVELAAGAELDAQRAALGDLPVGSAAITAAGELPAQFLIHVVVRSREEPVSPGGIRRGLQNALRRAVEWGIADLALPPLGTGAGNLDAEEAAAVMLPVLLEHLEESAYPAQIRIVVESEYELQAFRRELARASGATPLPLLDEFGADRAGGARGASG
jgi:O-acetyl-ADP-ribose deacetylase (regulator of RNase III)